MVSALKCIISSLLRLKSRVVSLRALTMHKQWKSIAIQCIGQEQSVLALAKQYGSIATPQEARQSAIIIALKWHKQGSIRNREGKRSSTRSISRIQCNSSGSKSKCNSSGNSRSRTKCSSSSTSWSGNATHAGGDQTSGLPWNETVPFNNFVPAQSHQYLRKELVATITLPSLMPVSKDILRSQCLLSGFAPFSRTARSK